VAALSASAAAAACGNSSPHDQAATVAKSDESTAASAQMLAQEWTNDHVPDKYARQTLDVLTNDLSQQRPMLASIETRDSLVNQTIAAHDSVTAQMNQLKHAFEASDKPAARHTAAALGAQSQRLDSLAKRLQPSP
jgi:hypothetical protein